MKVLVQRVWTSDTANRQLLVEREPGKYEVPGYGWTPEELIQLSQAIQDALRPEPATPDLKILTPQE